MIKTQGSVTKESEHWPLLFQLWFQVIISQPNQLQIELLETIKNCPFESTKNLVETMLRTQPLNTCQNNVKAGVSYSVYKKIPFVLLWIEFKNVTQKIGFFEIARFQDNKIFLQWELNGELNGELKTPGSSFKVLLENLEKWDGD